MNPLLRRSASTHLDDLLEDVGRLAARCAAVDASRRRQLASTWDTEAALATLRLDGSPIVDVPDPELIASARSTVTVVEGDEDRAGTWFDAMRTFDAPLPDDPAAAAQDTAVQALEYAGVREALAGDDLGPALLTDPVAALVDLHERLTRHLVAPERVGQLRRSEQAVHDASVGRILYFTVDPDRVRSELDTLAAWMVDEGRDHHGLVVAGTVHLELLRIHPFDAANGRLARAAARLLLRARGLDPDGAATFEPALDADRLGYHDEVARTLRRRDPTLWLERWGEAVSDGLRRSARALGQLETSPPAPLAAFVDRQAPGSALTVADLRAAGVAGTDPDRGGVRALLDAGWIERVPGSRGLRFTIPGP